MDDVDQTTAYRLTITVDDADFPIDQELRHALLDDLSTAVRNRLVERHGVQGDQDDIAIATAYRYAQVPAECPLCSEKLDLLSVHLNNENDAYPSARCSSDHCEWSGDAVYRIVDLEGSESNAVERNVLTGDIAPNYAPYRGKLHEGQTHIHAYRANLPPDDCDSHLGIGKPVYAGEQTDIAYADGWCSNEKCSFTACAQFALVDLLHKEANPQTRFVHAGEIEPRKTRYQR